MKSGRVRTRSGDVYKPSAVRSYDAALRDHVVPRLGPTRLGDVQRRDVQRIDRKARQASDGDLVFGTSAGTPFQPSNVWRRARTAWKRAELEPIGLHEARHTFASVLIAAGVNAKAITTYMGHASIQTTYDLYGKLMPDSESEATALVDAYLDRANSAARIAQLDQ